MNYTVYYPNENFVQIVNSSGTFTEKYVYQNGQLVAQINTDGQKQAIHSDNKGSNTLITDSTGAIVENTFYSPYGEILEGGKSSRYGYEGKEFDSATNRLDFHFRQIDPRISIWDKPDTLIQNVYDPQSLNPYAFERNNPYKYTDLTGHQNTNVVISLGGVIMIVSPGFLALLIALGIGFTILYINIDATTKKNDEKKEQTKLERKNDVNSNNPTYQNYKYTNPFGTQENTAEPSIEPKDPKKRKDKMSKEDSPTWKDIKSRTKPRKDNPQYRSDDKHTYRWDKTHGDIEKYRNIGKNKIEEIGSLDPE
ncbi:MAG: hypothetical protein HYU00_05595, partial [Nitrosarchaeum sp.]|nr:hypothetical protein [Nitrosarchaeum sp.]